MVDTEGEKLLTPDLRDDVVEQLMSKSILKVNKNVMTKYRRQKSTGLGPGAVSGEVYSFPITDSGTGAMQGDFGNVFYRSVKAWLLKLGEDPLVRKRWLEDVARLDDKYAWGRVDSEHVFSHPMRGSRAKRILEEAKGKTILLELYTDGVTHGKGIVGTRKKSKLVHVYVGVR